MRSGRARQLCPGSSDVDFFSYFNRVVDLDAEIPNRALDLGVTEQQLNVLVYAAVGAILCGIT